MVAHESLEGKHWMDKLLLWLGNRVRVEAADYQDIIQQDHCDAIINFIYPREKDKLGIFATARETVVQEFEEKIKSDDSRVKRGVVMTNAGTLPNHRRIFHIQVDFSNQSGYIKFRYAVQTALKMADKEEMRSICIPNCEDHSVGELENFYEDLFQFEKTKPYLLAFHCFTCGNGYRKVLHFNMWEWICIVSLSACPQKTGCGPGVCGQYTSRMHI